MTTIRLNRAKLQQSRDAFSQDTVRPESSPVNNKILMLCLSVFSSMNHALRFAMVLS